jgi:hypothetical protein
VTEEMDAPGAVLTVALTTVPAALAIVPGTTQTSVTEGGAMYGVPLSAMSKALPTDESLL